MAIRRRRKMRGWLKSSLLLVLVLLLIEGTVRVGVARLEGRGRENLPYGLDKVLSQIRLVPGIDGEPKYVYPTNLNSTHGRDYVGTAFHIQKPAGITRIIALGDSHLDYGSGLLGPRCFTDESPLPPRECLLFSGGGYDLADKEAALLSKALSLEPDVVVLQLLDDDCITCRSAWDFAPQSVNWQGRILAAAENAYKAAYRASYLFRVAWWTGWGILARDGIITKSCVPFSLEKAEECTSSMDGMVDAVRGGGISLVTVLSYQMTTDTDGQPVDGNARDFRLWFDRTAEDYALSPLVLQDAFSGQDYRELRADEKGHFNERGYEIARQAFYDHLVARGVISP